jgi:hypothetical protein
MLAKLKKEMEEAYILLVRYQALYDRMQKNLGYVFMSYEQDGDVYTFSDGAIFNYATQDFIFPDGSREDVFQVFHIAFGEKVLSTKIEESFVHMHYSQRDLKTNYTLRRVVEDKNTQSEFTKGDSIQLMEIFRVALDKDLKIHLIAEAGGIVEEKEGMYYRDSTKNPTENKTDGFENSGLTVYRADKGSNLQLRITVWGEQMIPYAFTNYQAQFGKFKAKYPDLNEVDFYTGIKAKQKATQWIDHLKKLVPLWFKKTEDQAKLLKALSAAKVGTVWFKGGQIKTKVPEAQ